MKILSTDDMLAAAEDSKMPNLDAHVEAVETASDNLATALAAHLGITKGLTDYERGFGGTCGCFGPATPGQPCPEVIHGGDPSGDWEEEDP